MDWQPNDRLGRVRRQLFEHRREVLRRHTKPNTHTNADAYPNVHANSDTNSKPYPYSHTHAHPDRNAMRGETCTHTAAAPDSATAPVACNVSWKR